MTVTDGGLVLLTGGEGWGGVAGGFWAAGGDGVGEVGGVGADGDVESGGDAGPEGSAVAGGVAGAGLASGLESDGAVLDVSGVASGVADGAGVGLCAKTLPTAVTVANTVATASHRNLPPIHKPSTSFE